MKTFTVAEVFFIKLWRWDCIESNKLHIRFRLGIFVGIFFVFSELLSEAYLERSGTYTVKLFNENSYGLKAANDYWKKASITDVCLGYNYAYGSSAKQLKVAGACLCEKHYDRSLVIKKKQLIIHIFKIFGLWMKTFANFKGKRFWFHTQL